MDRSENAARKGMKIVLLALFCFVLLSETTEVIVGDVSIPWQKNQINKSVGSSCILCILDFKILNEGFQFHIYLFLLSSP